MHRGRPARMSSLGNATQPKQCRPSTDGGSFPLRYAAPVPWWFTGPGLSTGWWQDLRERCTIIRVFPLDAKVVCGCSVTPSPPRIVAARDTGWQPCWAA